MERHETEREYYDNHEMTAADWIKHLSNLEPDCKVRVQLLIEDRNGVTDLVEAGIDVGRWKVRDHDGKGGPARLVVIETSGIASVRDFK